MFAFVLPCYLLKSMVKLLSWPSSSFQLIANINSELATKKICNKVLIVILKIFFFMCTTNTKVLISAPKNKADFFCDELPITCCTSSVWLKCSQKKAQQSGASFPAITRLTGVHLQAGCAQISQVTTESSWSKTHHFLTLERIGLSLCTKTWDWILPAFLIVKVGAAALFFPNKKTMSGITGSM